MGRDSLHLYIGFFCLFIMIIFWKDKRSFLVLVPGLLLSFLLEIADLHDDGQWLGYYRWSASFHDIVNTNLLPLLTFLIFRRYISNTKL